jgi:L-ascorbate metabolism protein UlaG (beta-lactamase superfamily)
VVVPRGLAGLLRNRKFDTRLEVEDLDSLAIGTLRIRAVPAEHEGARSAIGVSADPVGYVVEGSKSIYFAGDTDLFDEMHGLGPVDLALIPIWGWGPGLGRGAHLDPAKAAEAAARIRPEVVVPIHWGTYFPIHRGLTKTPGFVDLPPLEFVTAMKETAPDVRVEVLRPGESLELV